MKIEVRYFALAADLAGCPGESLEFSSGIDVAAALQEVQRLHPALAGAGFTPLVAVNRVHSHGGQALADGDELAIFPPVSGG